MVLLTLVLGLCAMSLSLAGWTIPARGLLVCNAGVVVGWKIWSMIRELRHGHLGLDLLAAVAIVATLLVSEFWAAWIIALMITSGAALEDYANSRARRDLGALLDRAPRVAHRVGAGGTPEDIPAADVVVGDLIVVRPGEVVPVDGTVVDAAASFDESSTSGEPLPVEREVGDVVLSGAVVEQRACRIRAVARAADSQYQQIVDLVAGAAESRSPMVRLADRYAVPFTIVALLIAGLGWWLSGDPVRFAEVLVVATPCPLLIAAPVAFLAGMSRAASSGVVMRSGTALEKLARVRTMAFDKTGTLTYGHPTVVGVEPEPGTTPEQLLSSAAALEAASGHVLAGAVVSAARDRGLPELSADRVEETTGAGVQGEVQGHLVVVGRADHVETVTGHRVPQHPLAQGQIAIHVGDDEAYLGRILLSDELRGNVPATLDVLTGLGIRNVVMLTGDGPVTAHHIAEQAGITQVKAGLMPAGKVEAVTSMPDRPVAMVGDGINDAPVLAAADVGVAMGAKGATAASESAEVVILVDDISRVATGLTIARRTVHVALTAVWLGMGLSLGLMIFAVWGWLPALAGALLQEVVDLVSILTALRAVRPGRQEAVLENLHIPDAQAGASAADQSQRGEDLVTHLGVTQFRVEQ
ncbi:heavy metal translocating P-type ATPase [Propionibacterium sp.]|uniref:heavy metal translocating P-type ATPase n=1 Tax=Propionibacterium sp. TaxID=1977903 RepID=UPI0039EACD8B